MYPTPTLSVYLQMTKSLGIFMDEPWTFLVTWPSKILWQRRHEMYIYIYRWAMEIPINMVICGYPDGGGMGYIYAYADES